MLSKGQDVFEISNYKKTYLGIIVHNPLPSLTNDKSQNSIGMLSKAQNIIQLKEGPLMLLTHGQNVM